MPFKTAGELWKKRRKTGKLAPVARVHGALMDVYGVGVLLLGKSSIGKSECALDLVKREHRLVADDIVQIRRTDAKNLFGSSVELLGYNIEIRGLGIINIKELFGVGAIRKRKKVELVIIMEEWKKGKEYERLGLEEEYHDLMDIKLPRLVIPVRPGRNIAMIVEVACMNHRLKEKGYNAAREFDRVTLQKLKRSAR